MGGNVTVSVGIKVVQGAVLGTGSVVTTDVAPYTIVAANPARFID
jgi:acetyltransferase-like isoleucine patch superfamily enzyme